MIFNPVLDIYSGYNENEGVNIINVENVIHNF